MKFNILKIFIILLIVSGCSFANNKNENIINDIIRVEEMPIIKQTEMFYEENNFNQALEFAIGTEDRNDVYEIILPHHLLVSKYIASLIKMASGREIERVVIIGPNHENVGRNIFNTTDASWETPLGIVEADRELVQNLKSKFNLYSSIEIFKKEHSIGAVVPFVKAYLPKAKIIPIVFTSNAGIGDVNKISDWLNKNLDDKSLVIISTDFSHYLTKEEADKNDLITKKLIEKKDLEKIIWLNNDYVDSPASLAIALKYADLAGLNYQIIYNSNSFNESIIKTTQTTSYFGIIFIHK